MVSGRVCQGCEDPEGRGPWGLPNGLPSTEMVPSLHLWLATQCHIAGAEKTAALSWNHTQDTRDIWVHLLEPRHSIRLTVL